MRRQPRMVANATSMVARDLSSAAAGPTRPAASARVVTAEGTYTVPAQRPQMDASINNVLRMVRRRNDSENSAAKGRQMAQECTTRAFAFHREGSLTP